MSETWVLVPVEPTDDMKEAGWVAFRDSDKPAPFNQVADGIAASLAARPPIPRAVWDAMVERGARAHCEWHHLIWVPDSDFALSCRRATDAALRAALNQPQVEGDAP